MDLLTRSSLFILIIPYVVTLWVSRDVAKNYITRNDKNSRILEIPYEVSLQYIRRKLHFCAGCVLNEKWVVTAAHCVDKLIDIPSTIKVIAGTFNLENPQSTHYVNRIIIHEDYNANDSWKNDIALLEVIEKFRHIRNIVPIKLPKSGIKIQSGDLAVVSGWSRLSQNSRKLERLRVEMISREECARAYGVFGLSIHESQICADVPDGATGSCNIPLVSYYDTLSKSNLSQDLYKELLVSAERHLVIVTKSVAVQKYRSVTYRSCMRNNGLCTDCNCNCISGSFARSVSCEGEKI